MGGECSSAGPGHGGPGCSVCAGACVHACTHVHVCAQRTLLSVLTSQQTKQQCQPGDSTAGSPEGRAGDSPSPSPLHLQLLGKSLSPLLLLFGLCAKQRAPQVLGSSAVISCLRGLFPAPGVGTDPALPPLCPIPAERCRDVPWGEEAREAGGNAGEQEGQRCLLAPGAATEAWAPLLPSFSCTCLCICHQWKFPLGLPVLGLASSFCRTTLQPGAGGCFCSR